MKGGQRRPDLDYPDKQFMYYSCASKFGWTPEQTDNAPAALVDWMLMISTSYDKIKAEKGNDIV